MFKGVKILMPHFADFILIIYVTIMLFAASRLPKLADKIGIYLRKRLLGKLNNSTPIKNANSSSSTDKSS